MISLTNYNGIPSILKRAVKELQNAVSGGGVNLVDVTGTSLLKSTCQVLSADGAIPIQSGVAAITKASAAALTIAAPTTAQNGTLLSIISTTAYAHVITFTGGTLNNGTSTAKTTVTLPAYVGGGIRIIAYNGKWYLSGNQNATLA